MEKKLDLRTLLLSAQATGGPKSAVTAGSDADALRDQLAQLLSAPNSQPETQSEAPAEATVAEIPSGFSSVLPSLLELKTSLLEELEANLSRLLALNPGRREMLARYLEKLAGMTPGPSAAAGQADSAAGLRRWIEGPRTPAQNAALRRYFEEISLITLGQALLLKAWSDRGIRNWSRNDLNNLNWALAKALKPVVPLDRDGWQITRSNLYSWYIPSPQLQDQIWARFEPVPLSNEGPTCLAMLLNSHLVQHTRSGGSLGASAAGYDSRFLKGLWEATSLFMPETPADPDGLPLKRHRIAFSPTLRDGTMVRTGPVGITWIGTEESQFLLLSAELAQLWWGPSAPPLWAAGNGLDAHSRDQLTLGLGLTKPTLMSRIAEIESCDTAFVLEEKPVRGQGRGVDAQSLREQLDALPWFKKLRKPGTSLGTLQACVALSKLRPGGLLWWAREESLSPGEGQEALNYILDRARIAAAWNFSELQHSLPVSLPLFPKHLYLLVRENRIEERLNHRPLSLSVKGSLRSHVEIPLLYRDAFHMAQEPATTPGFHGQWQIRASKSPTSQQEWAERWPEPACENTMRTLELLRSSSLPLAQAATIRRTPESDPTRPWAIDPSLSGFWLDSVVENERRKLVIRPLPRAGSEAAGQGFLVLLNDESWIAPLQFFLQSQSIERWLDASAERRAGRWILDEQTVRFLPIPRVLWQALGVPSLSADQDTAPTMARPLPGDWENLATEVGHKPRRVRDALIAAGAETPSDVRATLFVRAARVLQQAQASYQRLASVVSPDGMIRWKGIFEILPKAEPLALHLHPDIRINGKLPHHIPIATIETIKTPSPGILLMTELGLHVELHSDNPRILEMIRQQLNGAEHPTWSEILEHVRIPRRIDLAEATASDILRSYGEQSLRMAELSEVLSACQVF